MSSPERSDYARAIIVRGARVNNLRGVDVDIPKRQLVVFTGVSGSGKSSLAFDTIAAESQRMLNETYPAFVQNLMPHLPRPDVDRLEHLSAAIVVTQAAMSGNPRSTVGTATGTVSRLRTLYAQHGTPHVPGPAALSFNDPAGACPDCAGTGQRAALDVSKVLDETKSLNDGAITFPNFAVDSLFWKVYARCGVFDNDQPIARYTTERREHLLTGTGPSVDTGTHPMAYEGVLNKIQRLYLGKSPEALKPRLRAAVLDAATVEPCGACGGSRLSSAARACRIEGTSIADASRMQAVDLAGWLDEIELPGHLQALRARVVSALRNMDQVGLGYLALDRPTSTLSGGEAQRIRTVLHLDSALTELTYVFDEPAAGLHPHDIKRVIELLHRLRDKGNNVLVVEHQPDVIRAADHIIDMGPQAGTHGGLVVFQGTPAQLAQADTLTATHLNRRQPVKTTVRQFTGALRVENASRNNLRSVTVDVPLGCLVTITGVAGAGKTSLLASLPRTDGLAVLDQTPIRGSRRSSAATYSRVLDDIRAEFATANKTTANLFSPNSTGGCSECTGLGVIYTATFVGDDITTTCPTCHGRRFHDHVLRYTLRGKSIAEVLDMPIETAADFFADSPAADTLRRLDSVGLGYVHLGQPLVDLSGGERQRLRLAIEMGRRPLIYVLDEPTNGLHLADVETLIKLFDTLVTNGASIIIAEHHQDLIARSDWVIDLGPDAGHDGGTVVFQGTPAELIRADTHTGRALRASYS
ncbi:ATP-binding cassette domain-containing protein [Pengzhenrongella phosphoraccumulans]|uniref:ATP-binding cassette domain-containing protein n=1 Tax=Pengzhenrongella phosphoraccumulans TaxID=3114394 RepID=UPI00388F290A